MHTNIIDGHTKVKSGNSRSQVYKRYDILSVLMQAHELKVAISSFLSGIYFQYLSLQIRKVKITNDAQKHSTNRNAKALTVIPFGNVAPKVTMLICATMQTLHIYHECIVA